MRPFARLMFAAMLVLVAIVVVRWFAAPPESAQPEDAHVSEDAAP